MPKLRTLTTRIATLDTRTAKPPPKQADPYYLTAAHRAWRERVIANAGRRCEWAMPDGSRCIKAEPRHRMFADHVSERRDGGPDQGRGMCLCGAHHSLKTARERVERQWS